jgi:hypothetical protein
MRHALRRTLVQACAAVAARDLQARCRATQLLSFVNASPLALANVAPIERVTLPLDAAVTTRQGVKFSNGMLIERTATRPSSLVGILNIPVDVVKAVVSIPSALFQFKVSSTKTNPI